MSNEHRLGPPHIHHDWDGVGRRRSGFVRTTSSTSTCRSPARARSRRRRPSTRSCGTSTRSTTWPGPSSSREPRPATRSRSRFWRSLPARGGGRPSCPSSVCSPTTSRAVPEGLRPARRSGGDRRPWGRGAARSLPRDDGRCHGRAGAAFPLPSPQGRRKRRLSPSRRRLDALAADLVRGSALLVWRRAWGAGRRRGVRQRSNARWRRRCGSGSTSARSPARRSASHAPSGIRPALRDDGHRLRPDGGCEDRRPQHDRVARRGAGPDARRRLCALQPGGRPRIHEIVDAGVWNVGMVMPLSVFG